MLQLDKVDNNSVVNNGISIDNDKFKKYNNAEEIFSSYIFKPNGYLIIKENILETKKINIKQINCAYLKKLAYYIFSKYNNGNIFINNKNKILVSKSGINESVQKIFQSQIQRNLLKEHLLIFANLGVIIEHSKLVNQSPEIKSRQNIIYWNYYFDRLIINGKRFSVLFDVRTLESGQNQYRVQRIKKVDNSARGQ